MGNCLKVLKDSTYVYGLRINSLLNKCLLYSLQLPGNVLVSMDLFTIVVTTGSMVGKGNSSMSRNMPSCPTAFDISDRIVFKTSISSTFSSTNFVETLTLQFCSRYAKSVMLLVHYRVDLKDDRLLNWGLCKYVGIGRSCLQLILTFFFMCVHMIRESFLLLM